MTEIAQTFGERAVGLAFNPSGDPVVHELKQAMAEFVDICAAQREKATDPEIKRMYSIAITEAQTAQMWGVKAATWRVLPPITGKLEITEESSKLG
jgi:hypothetical protein